MERDVRAALHGLRDRVDVLERQVKELGLMLGIPQEDLTVFTDTVKRYVTSDPEPKAEGDWQLHSEGHEGEDK